MPNVIGIIPARYQSKRFPGKPLALISGVPLVVRVMRSAQTSHRLNDIMVATDDHRIAEAVRDYGGKAVLSKNDHLTGSDRAAEIAAGLDCDFVVNIQGDEPFLSGEIVDKVIAQLESPDVVMSTACSPLRGSDDDPNVVKVVMDRSGNALYFSRSRIPFDRSGNCERFYRHIGIYGFKRDFLLRYANLPRTPLEICESLEQLRALEHGYKIRVIVVDFDFVGIDSINDLSRAEEILSRLGKRNDEQ